MFYFSSQPPLPPRPSIDEVHPAISSFAKQLGIPLAMRRGGSGEHLWNGNNLGIMLDTYRLHSPEVLVHELFHWVVAVPSLRDKPEYGLRSPTFTNTGFLPWEEQQSQEIRTRLLGNEFSAKHGFDRIPLRPFDKDQVDGEILALENAGYQFRHRIWYEVVDG